MSHTVITQRDEVLLKMQYPLLFICRDLKNPRNVDKLSKFFRERIIDRIMPLMCSTTCISYATFLKTCQHFKLSPNTPDIKRIWDETFTNIKNKLIIEISKDIILNEIMNPFLVRHGFMPIHNIDDQLTRFEVIGIM